RVSAWGLALFVLGLVGYATGASLVVAGLKKIVMPHDVGVWISPGGFNIGTTSNPAAREVLGWWLVPAGLAVGALVVVGTTMLRPWPLRLAGTQRPGDRPSPPCPEGRGRRGAKSGAPNDLSVRAPRRS